MPLPPSLSSRMRESIPCEDAARRRPPLTARPASFRLAPSYSIQIGGGIVAVVNSVLGPLDTSDMGFTLTHEHIITGSAGFRYTYPEMVNRRRVGRGGRGPSHPGP